MFADTDTNDRYEILSMIVNNTADTLFMHEWFAWANAYFSVFANCLHQFIAREEVERVVNDTIPLHLLNVTYADIHELKDVEIDTILNKPSCVRQRSTALIRP